MHRKRVIVTAILFAILGGALPMAAMYYVSWTRAVHKEQKQLKIIAERVLVRARTSFQQASKVLKTLDRTELKAVLFGAYSRNANVNYQQQSG